ncbi:MAG: hypothetical protein CVU69_10610 [Deltaproteobacteria bacterium HGW-Deltaproteobacteria-4]|jgi:predicted transcriptional regulator|nr:MAG: hypothetical protein CVU69_10610 [Deltaproteobacteria bacterium HGW-Deltaproteobacteria-4]
MLMARSAIESCLTSLPETVDSEEVMYRLYLLEKIEAGEKDLREGRVVSHDEAMERLARRWQG